MPNIKETVQIIEATPIDQPILLQGVHGVGKSQILKEVFEERDYTVIPLFLGQMSDAGDILGLPDRTTTTVNGVEHKITTFCPPSWWPLDPKAKVILFLDELNRAKPEIHQVIMDLVLNRKLAGRELPPQTRIVGAINPIDEGVYQVEELDVALWDRFNVYDFRPSFDEWMDWALKNKIHHHIMGFLSRNQYLLDPPTSDGLQTGKVYQSRRSWERSSVIMNNDDELVNNPTLLGTLMLGVVGTESTSSLMKYLRDHGQDLYAGIIITKWDKGMEEKVKALPAQDAIHLNREIRAWFNENEDTVMDIESNKTNTAKYSYNLENYMNAIPTECMMEMFKAFATLNNEGKKWPNMVMTMNVGIQKKAEAMMRGAEV